MKHFGCPLVYVNQVGGNDELVFDGNSVAFDAQGNVIAHAKAFEEDLVIVDIDSRVARASRPGDSSIRKDAGGTPVPRERSSNRSTTPWSSACAITSASAGSSPSSSASPAASTRR